MITVRHKPIEAKAVQWNGDDRPAGGIATTRLATVAGEKVEVPAVASADPLEDDSAYVVAELRELLGEDLQLSGRGLIVRGQVVPEGSYVVRYDDGVTEVLDAEAFAGHYEVTT